MWILFAVAAGTLQTLRNVVSQRIAQSMPAELNSWGRFTFALPWALLAVALLSLKRAQPVLSVAFLLTCAVAGLGQLLANVALVAAFRRTGFTAAILLHKLEVVWTAVAGFALFQEWPRALGWSGILRCTLGAVAIHLAGRESARDHRTAPRPDAGMWLAMLAGALLVVASFGVKQALSLLALDNPTLADDPLLLPAHTLLHVTWLEVAMLSLSLLLRRPGSFRAVPQHARSMALLGLFACASSLCWYAAFAQGLVAYVRALGQVESVLSVGIGLWLLDRKRTQRQLPAAAVIVAGIILIVLG